MRTFRNVFIAIAVLMVACTIVIKAVILPNVASVATEQIVSSVATSVGLTNSQAEYLNANIDPADVDKVESIIENHMFDTEVISQAATAVQNGDISSLQKMADETLTPEEQEELKSLYEKYKDVITEEDWPEY